MTLNTLFCAGIAFIRSGVENPSALIDQFLKYGEYNGDKDNGSNETFVKTQPFPFQTGNINLQGHVTTVKLYLYSAHCDGSCFFTGPMSLCLRSCVNRNFQALILKQTQAHSNQTLVIRLREWASIPVQAGLHPTHNSCSTQAASAPQIIASAVLPPFSASQQFSEKNTHTGGRPAEVVS
jgi:hypothetical protein